MVQKSIEAFVVYLNDVKKTSHNTKMSYQRDLNKMCNFFEENGIREVSQVNENALPSYIDYLKDNEFLEMDKYLNIMSISYKEYIEEVDPSITSMTYIKWISVETYISWNVVEIIDPDWIILERNRPIRKGWK